MRPRPLYAVLVLSGILLGLAAGQLPSALAVSGRGEPVAALESIETRLTELTDQLTSLRAVLRPESNGRTRLLFPFVTNTAGFDTGLSIANTGQQPGGAIGQSGTCLISFFGSNPPADITTPSVAQGQTRQVLVSDVAPSFQGYVIATCQFPLAHGFYVVSDVGFNDFAHGGHALVLPPERDTDVVEAVGS